MRFDDIELLRSIDEYEQTATGNVYSGFALIQAIAGGTIPSEPNDYRQFARELLLARDAGLLVFEELRYAGSATVDPNVNAHYWLQQTSDIRLTSAGRDRARGRVIQQPPPDPDEDDGRPIPVMTLEDIARVIGSAYSGTQIPRFLTSSGIPDAYLPPFDGTKWEYVLAVLLRLEETGSESRRILRHFVGAWLDNRLHSRPTEDGRREILRHLNQQGWQLHDGRIVAGDPTAGEPSPPARGSRADRISRLHPRVREAAAEYVETHLEVAVGEALKAVNRRVRELSGLPLDGVALMGRAFADRDGPLRLGDSTTESGRNVQEGYRFLFMGAVRGIRNPSAHEPLVALSDEEAFEQLGLASLLMRRLDEVDSVSDVAVPSRQMPSEE